VEALPPTSSADSAIAPPRDAQCVWHQLGVMMSMSCVWPFIPMMRPSTGIVQLTCESEYPVGIVYSELPPLQIESMSSHRGRVSPVSLSGLWRKMSSMFTVRGVADLFTMCVIMFQLAALFV
jgi:hypothetical protein